LLSIYLDTASAEGGGVVGGGLEVSELTLLDHLGGDERVGGGGRCRHGHVLNDGLLYDGYNGGKDGGLSQDGSSGDGVLADGACSELLNGSDLSVDGGCLHDLLVDGLGVLNHGGNENVTLQDGLDLFDDSLSDGLLDDGGVDDLGSEGGVSLDRGEDDVLLDGGGPLNDGSSDLSGEFSLLDLSGLDLSLVHHLGDLSDVELFSLSVDDGLDLLLHHGVDSLLDNDVLLDGLDDGGLSTDESERRSLCRLDVTSLAESKTLLRVQDTVTVSV